MPNTCPHCGTATIADARFCRACGQALAGQAPSNAATGPVPPPGATVALTDRPVRTDELDQNLPGTVSFETVVDRPDYNTVIDRNVYAPLSGASTDPKSTNYLPPGDPALTAALSPQQTTNLAEANTIALGTGAFPPAAEEQAKPTVENPSARAISHRAAGNHPPPPVVPAPVQPLSPATRAFTAPPTVAAAPPPAMRPPARGGVRPWHIVAGVSIVLVLLGGILVGALLFIRGSASDSAAQSAAPTPAPVNPAPTPDAAQMLADAETLLASGDAAGALKLLRQVAQAEPANGEAQRRLGDLLLTTGARVEAIAAYRAATVADPKDAAAWRGLAAAQFEEKQYAESANSYQQLLALQGEAAGEDTRLAFADALRAAGQNEEARTTYENLARSATPEISAAARQRLAELTGLQTIGTPAPEATRTARQRGNQSLTPVPAATAPAQLSVAPPSPAPPPTAAAPPTPEPARLTAADHYRRGVELWNSNRGAAVSEFLRAASGVPDANYYLGLNIAEGRDPQSLGRAQLVSALYYFQVAQRGSHGAQARRYADQLGKEYDRRRGVTGQ